MRQSGFRALALGVLVGGVLVGWSGSVQAAGCVTPGNFYEVAAGVEEAMNADRARAGLRRVALSRDLMRAAQRHACDMAERGYFSHSDPAGTRPSQRVRRAGYKSCLTAENIARGQKSVAEVHSAWMGSNGHRKNILLPDIRDIGIGVVQPTDAARPKLHWVVVMAKPC